MSSYRVSQKLPSCPEEEKRFMDCVYCHKRGPFFKNGTMMWGKHHVKFCCKAEARKQTKRDANRRKPTFTKEDGGWLTKRSSKKNNKTRVTSGAKTVLEKSKDPFSILGAMNAEAESKRLKQEAEQKRLKQEEEAKIRAAEAAKKAPRPATKKSPGFGGWLAVAKAKKPVAKKPVTKKPVAKVEIPVVSAPKRANVSKKATKAPTVYKKGSVMSFEEVEKLFSNTDSWGDDSDEEC